MRRLGLATGASTGAIFGVLTIWGVGAGRRNTATPSLVDALTGTAFGALLGPSSAIIPSLVDGLLVTGLIGHLHPQRGDERGPA